MACISKLASAISYDCDTGATGLASALIINKADIASFAISSGLVDSITLKSGASAYKIDTVKRSLVVSASLKVNEGAPNAYTHTATIVDTGDRDTSESVRNRLAAYTNGSFVILTRPVSRPTGSVFGLYYGMSATSVDYSTHDNGRWVTVVASTPENVIGEDSLLMSDAVYDALYAAAI